MRSSSSVCAMPINGHEHIVSVSQVLIILFVIMDEWRKGNTAFAFWQGLQKEGRAVVTLPSGYARVAMLPFRTDGIPLHAATALLAGWPDLCEAWSQSHRFLLCLFPYALVPRWLLGLA